MRLNAPFTPTTPTLSFWVYEDLIRLKITNEKPLPYDAWGKIIYMEAWQGLTSYEVNLTSSTPSS